MPTLRRDHTSLGTQVGSRGRLPVSGNLPNTLAPTFYQHLTLWLGVIHGELWTAIGLLYAYQVRQGEELEATG